MTEVFSMITYSLFDLFTLSAIVRLFSLGGRSVLAFCQRWLLRQLRFYYSAVPIALWHRFRSLIQVLPTLSWNYIQQFIVTLVVLAVVRGLAGTFTHRVSRMAHWEPVDVRAVPDNVWDGAVSPVITGAVLLMYHIIYPVLAAMGLLLPNLLVRVIGAVVLLAVDFTAMLYAVRPPNVDILQPGPYTVGIMNRKGWRN